MDQEIIKGIEAITHEPFNLELFMEANEEVLDEILGGLKMKKEIDGIRIKKTIKVLKRARRNGMLDDDVDESLEYLTSLIGKPYYVKLGNFYVENPDKVKNIMQKSDIDISMSFTVTAMTASSIVPFVGFTYFLPEEKKKLEEKGFELEPVKF